MCVQTEWITAVLNVPLRNLWCLSCRLLPVATVDRPGTSYFCICMSDITEYWNHLPGTTNQSYGHYLYCHHNVNQSAHHSYALTIFL